MSIEVSEAIYEGDTQIGTQTRKFTRLGQCSLDFDCAKLNCCGDCEFLQKVKGKKECQAPADWDCGAKNSPTVHHWLQQTYWTRGEPKCSFTFKEEAVEVAT